MSDPKYKKFLGASVNVVSGPHEGRSGRVQEIRDVSINGGDPEGYAIVEYTERNCFNEMQTDTISVPIRKLSLRS